MLEVSGLSVSYGKHRALSDVAASCAKGEIVVVLGANGAGKSTLLKAIAGLVQPQPGTTVTLSGIDLLALGPHEIVEAGVALVPEGRGIFPDLTVRENLELGAYAARARRGETAQRASVLRLFPRLAERFGQRAGTMSGGEQQMVAIGRALMSAPDILLLDEPSLGLSPALSKELFQALARVRGAGLGILLVEQNARASLAIADRGLIIENGRNAGEGTGAALLEDASVQRAYLGGALSAAGGPPGRRRARQDHAALAGEPPRRLLAEPTPRDAPPTTPLVFAGEERRNRPPIALEDPPMNAINLLIAGKDRPATGHSVFERRNPISGEVASTVAAATIEDAIRAADAAAAAFPAWSQLGPNERRARLNKAADILAGRAEDFTRLMMAEIGATAGWAGFNVMLAAGMLREAAAMTTQIAGEVIPTDKPNNLAMAFRQPVGVVLGIAPWNAPVILGVRAVAMPLACGNTVVLKASEISPGVHRLIGQCLGEAGLGDGVVNVVTNAPEDAQAIVEALIAHTAVRRVNFTGSTRVGRIVAQMAAKYLKRALLELGGKAPLVVLDDADLDEAVKAAAFGAYMNQGQICMSTERLVVDEAIADAFVAKLADKARSLPSGDPRTGNVVLGSLVGAQAADRVNALIADAIAKGAKLVVGGVTPGTILPATIVDHVTPSMRLYGEESFGPVVTVVRVGSAEEAIRVANDTEYGLAAAVFGRDLGRALAVARRIESGICHVNAPTVHDEPQMPFGGMKASGYGRFGGKAAIDEFTELRWITVQTGPRPYPF
jgi:acyl-CoA reductase-like NAD-dependent aldehyde dehydrogenase/ABC-type branched-subunit amino acid transport system ATPase component